MVEIKLSQYCFFQLVNLDNAKIEEIEAAAEKATRFVESGTKKYPIVDFYVENDCLDIEKLTPCPLGDDFDGKGFKVSYGVLPKNNLGRIPIIHLTATVFNEDYIGKSVIPSLDPITIKQFNKFGSNKEGKSEIKFSRMDFTYPDVKATHMIEFQHLTLLAPYYPLDIFQVALPIHYLCNELNSNIKWHDPKEDEDYCCDVVRFWNERTFEIDYYADLWEYNPDINTYQRRFLLKKVKEKEIIFED